MKRLNFIIGVALLVVAATLAVHVSLREPRSAARKADELPADRQFRPGGGTRFPSSWSVAEDGFESSRLEPRTRTSPQSGGDTRPETLAVSVPPDHPERATLAAAAREVESHATAQLERLTRQLDLTRDQRRRLFPILARTSESYDPAMRIAGEAAGASALAASDREEQLQDVLSPTQQDELIEQRLKDAALWEEIIALLQERLAKQAPGPPAAEAPAAPPEPPPPPSRGRGNLYDRLGQDQ